MNSALLSLVLVIASNLVNGSFVVFSEKQGDSGITGLIYHSGAANTVPSEVTPLSLDQYTKVPMSSAFQFIRPLSSKLNVASRWVKFRINRSTYPGDQEPISVSCLATDIFLIYPFEVLYDQSNQLSDLTLALTAYKVDKVPKAERTGIMIKIRDNDAKVEIGFKQINTDELKQDHTFDVDAEGHIPDGTLDDAPAEHHDLGESTTELNEGEVQEDVGEKTQLNEERRRRRRRVLAEEPGDENKRYVFEHVSKVHVDIASQTNVKIKDYVLLEHSSGHFHVEQNGAILITLRVEGDTLVVKINKKGLIL